MASFTFTRWLKGFLRNRRLDLALNHHRIAADKLDEAVKEMLKE